MRKLLVLTACAVLSVGAVLAQDTKTVTGYVVDKNGNPLVGAEVMATGGGATTITDADGSFTLNVHPLLKKLTASYAGMNDKTLKIKDRNNLVFNMRAGNGRRGFISLIATGGLSSYKGYTHYNNHYEDSNTGSFGGGLMGGQFGNWGWYVKAMYYNNTDFEHGGSLTAGIIKQLGKTKTSLYLGGGYGNLSYVDGFAIDLGTIIRVSRHVNFIAGLNYVQTKDDVSEKYNLINVNVGLGYTF